MKRNFHYLAAAMRTLRSQTTFSQEDVSRLVGYKNGQFVSNMERGICGLPLAKVKLLCEVLECSPDTIKSAMLMDLSAEIDSYLEAKL